METVDYDNLTVDEAMQMWYDSHSTIFVDVNGTIMLSAINPGPKRTGVLCSYTTLDESAIDDNEYVDAVKRSMLGAFSIADWAIKHMTGKFCTTHSIELAIIHGLPCLYDRCLIEFTDFWYADVGDYVSTSAEGMRKHSRANGEIVAYCSLAHDGKITYFYFELVNVKLDNAKETWLCKDKRAQVIGEAL